MILDEIFEHKKKEVAAAKAAVPLADLKARIAASDYRPRGFARALGASWGAGRTTVVAEVKKGSPSRGVIRPDFDPVAIAGTYETAGATCLSVLTDEHFFLGHLRYLAQIRRHVRLPLLRKDFIYDTYQIWEAREGGADAILLIAAMLEPAQMIELAGLALELSLDALIEVHNERELTAALATGCELIGINNRDLRTFVTDLGTTERLAPLIPADRFVVAESGICDRADLLRLKKAGAKGFLIGESLVREADIGAKMREILQE